MKHLKLFEDLEDDSITSDKIKDLGYDRIFICSDGGTKDMTDAKKGDRTWITITYHGDNFMLRQRNDPKLNKIIITKASWPKEDRHPTEKILFDGVLMTMSELKDVLVGVGIEHKIR